MRSSTATERCGRWSGDAVDAVLHALAALDDAGVATVIGETLARLDDAGVLALTDRALGRLDEPRVFTVIGHGLSQLAANPLGGGIDDTPLAASIERLQRLEASVAGEKLRRVAEMAARGSSRATGDRSPADLLCRLGLTRGEAASQVAAAAALRQLPSTRAALERGDIGLGHATAAARTLGQLADAGGPVAGETVDRLDRLVAGTAGDSAGRGDPADGAGDAGTTDGGVVARGGRRVDRRELGRRLDGFAHTVNDDVLADRALRAKRLRRFSLTPNVDGAWTAAGQLEPVAGATLHGLLGRLARRHGPDDDRSQPQRMADALATVTTLAAGNPALRTADPADAPQPRR